MIKLRHLAAASAVVLSLAVVVPPALATFIAVQRASGCRATARQACRTRSSAAEPAAGSSGRHRRQGR